MKKLKVKDYGVNKSIYVTKKVATKYGLPKSSIGKVKRVPLSIKEIKKSIYTNLRVDGKKLTKRGLEKEYDKTRNKLRHYERVTGAKKQNPYAYLYYKGEAQRRYGKKYTPSNKARYIESFSSRSSGIKSTDVSERTERITTETIKNIYGTYDDKGGTGLLATNKGARALFRKYEGDPVKQLQALNMYASLRSKELKAIKHRIRNGEEVTTYVSTKDTWNKEGTLYSSEYDNSIKQQVIDALSDL